MGKLLHSKTFKNNLIKWLFIYTSVILIFMSVVTYSRYITSNTTTDKTRTAKFNISIEQGDICSTTSPDLCNLESNQYKPYDELEYYFTVDTKNFEVLTYLVLSVNVDENFDIISITDITDENNEQEKLITDNLNSSFEDETTIEYKGNNKFNLESTVGAYTKQEISNQENIKKYKVKIKYANENNQTLYNSSKAVTIFFSAEQID